VLLTLGGHHPTLPGRTLPTRVQAGSAGPPAAALQAANRFLTLEVARNNDTTDAQPDGTPPDPIRASYQGVSCQADLDQMAATGPTPPTPQSPRYTFTIQSVTPTTGGRYVLALHGVDTQTGHTGDGSYYLQLQSTRWVVCGLYRNTEPPATGNGSGGSGSGGGSGSNSGGGSGGSGGTSIDNSAGSNGSALTSSDPLTFLRAFAQAVNAADVNTAAGATCPNSPATATVQGWINDHDQLQNLSVADVQGPQADGQVQLATPGSSATTRYALWMQLAGQNHTWCIRAAAAA
jgi:hypothetical protein